MDNNHMGAMTSSNSMNPQMLSSQGKVQANSSNAASMHELCQRYMNQLVQLTTHDNQTHIGIITNLDHENVHVAVPNWGNDMWSSGPQRSMYGYGGYHGGWYPGGYYGYGRPPFHGGHFRPFNRAVFPLATLVALSLLPWY